MSADIAVRRPPRETEAAGTSIRWCEARPTARERRQEGRPGPHPLTGAHRAIHMRLVGYCANDPSAGSPTETLLRLLLPLSDEVHQTFRYNVRDPNIVAVRIIHRITQSVGATGGVYKGQGRNRRRLMTHVY